MRLFDQVTKRFGVKGRRPSLQTRVFMLEGMLFELNAYITRVVNTQNELSDYDTDFLEAAEEFRNSLLTTKEARRGKKQIKKQA